MTIEQLQKAKEIESKIEIVDKYLHSFYPERNIVWLTVSDQYGNGKITIPLYAHNEAESSALEPAQNKLTTYYRQFLQACTNDLEKRKSELEKALESI